MTNNSSGNSVFVLRLILIGEDILNKSIIRLLDCYANVKSARPSALPTKKEDSNQENQPNKKPGVLFIFLNFMKSLYFLFMIYPINNFS